jgi:membrane associated rhomboid family serine protease
MLFPVVGEFRRKYVPWVVIFLIAANLAVFFALQWGDASSYREAMKYYLDSGLADIEYAYYQKYTGEGAVKSALQRAEDSEDVPAPDTVRSMLRDGRFRNALRRGGLISQGDPEFEKWQDLHSTYSTKRRRITSYRYGLIPNRPAPLDWLTHMFLHGGLGHLLGNMLFLWLVGYVLETGVGHIRFAGIYLIGGLLAAAMFWACNRHMAFPLIGASGAISGAMGAMTVMYGLYRIKVFINLGFFFHYLRVPALVLLPIWLGKEGYHILSEPESSVAFTAHIGGLIGGAGIGWVNRRFLGFDPGGLFEEEPDRVSPVLEEAMAAIRRLDLPTARNRLRQVLDQDPDHSVALKQLFFLEAQDPEATDLSGLATRTLRALLDAKEPPEEVERIYAEYCHKDPRIRLDPELCLRLALQFVGRGRADLGEPLLVRALKSSVPLQEAPSALFRYGRHFRENGMERKSRACFQTLAKRFPDSLEARMVRDGEV